MNETLACSACGRSLHVPDDLRGQAVKCPACHHTFLAPAAGSEVGSIPPAGSAYEDAPPLRPVLRPDPDVYDSRSRYADTPEGGYHDAPVRRGGYEKPAKVQAIAVMTLAGGVLALLVSLIWALTCVGLLLPAPYSAVLGVLAVIKGASLLSDDARRASPPTAIAIMQIINVLSLDVFNLALGIITLAFLGDPEVKSYFRR
jgi:hypothetical protein